MSFELRRGGDTFRWHVIGADGSPDIALTVYASKAGERHSAATAKTYIRHLLTFASWAINDHVSVRQGWDLNGDPEAVRALVCRFLSIELKGVVTLTTDKHGFEIRRVECKLRNRRGDISHLLSALRSYYEVLLSEGQYFGENPMVGTFSGELIAREKKRSLERFAASHGRNPMPAASGVDDFRWKKASDSYFRLNGSGWEPEVLDDPFLQQEVLNAGIRNGWSRRDTCIARILFDTGCRVSEACSIRIIDWHSSDFGRTVLCINKGSRGDRTKTLYLSDKTVKLLRTYLAEDHPLSTGSFAEITNLSLETLDTSLFTTTTGSALSADWYRRSAWTPVLKRAGIVLRPHQVRHWFVTTAMLLIDELSASPEQRETERSKLRIMMGWSSDMIPTYNHAINRKSLPNLAAKIHERMNSKQQGTLLEIARKHELHSADSPRSAVDHMLSDLVGEK